MTQIDHAKATEVAQGFILIEKILPSEIGESDRNTLVVSHAYLARSEELATLEKNYDAAREEIMALERRAVDDAKHLEATMDRATENYNALAAENARLREALAIMSHAYRTENAPPNAILAFAESVERDARGGA